MPSNARIGKLTQFRRGDGGSPEVFTLVPGVTGTIQIGEESPEVDVTSFDSTAVERIADMADGVMMDFEINYENHAQQNNLIADVRAGINKNYQIYNPTFAKTFDVVLAPLKWSLKFVPKGEAIKIMFSGRISGSPVIT
jgi:hypothetical protein